MHVPLGQNFSRSVPISGHQANFQQSGQISLGCPVHQFNSRVLKYIFVGRILRDVFENFGWKNEGWRPVPVPDHYWPDWDQNNNKSNTLTTIVSLYQALWCLTNEPFKYLPLFYNKFYPFA